MNTAVLDALLLKYRKRGLLVDSNLLLLWFLGRYDVDELSRFKRTKKYTVEDFQLLTRVIEYFETVVTTPNILTEVSNLAGQLPDEVRLRYFATWNVMVSELNERYTRSLDITTSPHLLKLGLTDAGILFVGPAHISC